MEWAEAIVLFSLVEFDCIRLTIRECGDPVPPATEPLERPPVRLPDHALASTAPSSLDRHGGRGFRTGSPGDGSGRGVRRAVP